MIIKNLISEIYPFYGSAAIAGAILISLFFGLSQKKGFKIFVIIIAFIALISSFFLNIFYFPETENFSNYLFKFGFLQTIEVLVILFIAINILTLFCIRNFRDKNLIKIIIIFLFSLICLKMFIVANNFLMIFSGLVLFLICIFQLLTLLDGSSRESTFEKYSLRNYITGFILITVFSVLLLMAGFSLIYGGTDFKNITQIIESGKIENPMVIVGMIMILSGIYFYLFLFPFQHAYLKLARRCEGTSLFIILFLYFPAGIFLLLKFYEVLLFFIKTYTNIISIIFIIIASLCILGGNIGAIRAKSLRRIFLFLFLSITGMSVLALSNRITGLIEDDRTWWLILANIITCVLFYFPAFAIFFEIERKTGSDFLINIKGFLRSHKYLGINLIIILLSFLGLAGTSGYIARVYYVQSYIYFMQNNFVSPGSNINHIIISAVISFTGVLFMAANVIRIIVTLIQRPQHSFEIQRFPKFYYPYLMIYSLIVLVIGIIGIFELYGSGISFIRFGMINIF